MSTKRILVGTFLMIAIAIAVASSTAHAVPLTTERVASGLARPLLVTYAPGDFQRVFIVEQRSGSTGRIRILNLESGVLNATPFLSVSGVSTGNEQGLLGLAFHPNYQTNGYFYVNYTTNSGGNQTRVVRYTVSANPDIADAASATTIMTISQPFSNHNGGWIEFGPDGYLYIGTGDGGSGGDPGDRAQNINNNLGKMLRIDVDGGFPYVSPPDNPYVGVTGLDEIWAIGLRNPWRCSFDRWTGDLWIGDVGQNAYEEIDFTPAGTGGGVNYGWRCREGANPFTGSSNTPCPSCSDLVCLTDPIYDYPQAGNGFCVTGGYVYRGCEIPDLQGTYFFADYVTSKIWSFVENAGAVTFFTDRTAELDPPSFSIGSISSFGEDAAGELYICDLGGEVFRIIPVAALNPADLNSDKFVNLGDADTLVEALLGLTTPGDCETIRADVNKDGENDGLDIQAWLDLAI